ncbi:MAG: hypothetical protein A3I78_11115 [Gammaproteobacteria bacterium RIFCSPLOWO2_02_FULL_56_15]|nr:MAG: hypothetical protein A3I78_11115 [Gammaproteobacteria bacterium RIFCSPLOWO2_02_FULL_56_15]
MMGAESCTEFRGGRGVLSVPRRGSYGARVKAVADVTTDVGADAAVAEPAEFDAVTATRSVLPISAGPRRYVALVAPLMLAQLAPPLLQRSH